MAATEGTRGALTFVTTVDSRCGCLAVSLADLAPGLNPLRTHPVVTEVLRTGYLWSGRVIRPAMVKVAG